MYTECKSCFSEIEESQKSGTKCNTLQSESTLVIGINITTMYIFMNIYVVMYIPITRVCMHACSPVKRDSTSHLLYEFQVSEHITCMDS